MKLIDILVRELPELGGWPPSTESLYQNAKGRLVGTQGCILNTVDMKLSVVADDTHRSVTREQYEAALAASKPEWDGEGLPPVGCEFLFGAHQSKAKCIAVGRDVIFASIGDPDEEDCMYEEFTISIHHSEFRPIRSEADKKKEAVEKAIADALFKDGDFDYAEALRLSTFVYGAISRNEIPHIRID